MIGPAGYALAVLALVVGFIAGTWAGVASDWVRDMVDYLRWWFMIISASVVAAAVLGGIVYAVAHFHYHAL